MSNIDTYLKEFSHFEKQEQQGPGWFVLWATDECEGCGAACEAPNSANVRIDGEALAAFAANNVTERAVADSAGELGWSDDFGGAVCNDCYDTAAKEAEAEDN